MKRGLVLSGGGAKGAYEVGVLKYLIEKGITDFAVISGTSIGAFNASLLVSFGINKQGVEKLVQVWKTLGTRKIYRIQPCLSAVANSGPARNTLKQHLNLNHIIKSPVKLLVCSTNLQTREETAFSNKDPRLKQKKELLIDMIISSMSIPVVFSPVKIGSFQFVDGGVGNNTPLINVIKEGCEEIYTVILGPKTDIASTKKYGTIPEIAWRAQDCIGVNSQKEDIQRANEISKSIESYSKAEEEVLGKITDPELKKNLARIFEQNRPFPDKKRLKIFYVQPKIKLPVETKDFNPAMNAEVIELGYHDARLQLPF